MQSCPKLIKNVIKEISKKISQNYANIEDEQVDLLKRVLTFIENYSPMQCICEVAPSPGILYKIKLYDAKKDMNAADELGYIYFLDPRCSGVYSPVFLVPFQIITLKDLIFNNFETLFTTVFGGELQELASRTTSIKRRISRVKEMYKDLNLRFPENQEYWWIWRLY